MITPSADITAWFSGRLPAAWTRHGGPDVVVDREEITVVLEIAAPTLDDDTAESTRSEAIAGRIAGFRDETREQRVSIAREAEQRFERKVAWGVSCDGHTALFTHIAVPAMTRLRQPERQVLDTLIAAGVAKSRADALAWCVKLVGQHTDEWLADLRRAIDDVDRVRAEGPAV
jgi:hypothetical protein